MAWHADPLAALRASLGNLSASAYLDLLDRRHRDLGFGAMAKRREKVAQALRFFDAAREADYNTNGYVRDNALFLASAAEAHLALGNVSEACGLARQAFTQNTGIDSTRPADAIAGFRRQLQRHRSVPEARDFLIRKAERQWSGARARTAATAGRRASKSATTA